MRLPLFAVLLAASPAAAEVPHVVADIPVVQSLVAQVMGDLGQPAVMLGQGGNAHTYQMRPSEAAALQKAQLVVWIGPELTPWLERAIEGNPGAKLLTLLDLPQTVRHDFGEAAEDAQEHNHAGAEEAGAPDDGNDQHHTGVDPHAWLEPLNAEQWVDAIATELSALDPDHAAQYAANAASAHASIAATDGEVKAMFNAAPKAPVVFFHEAYGYFADHYGLDVAGNIALGDAASPGAARLGEIRDALQHEGVVCVFPDAQHDPKLAVTLAEGTGVRVGAALDPSGSTTEPGPELYQAVILGLGRNISDCLADR